jgi:hypothetical protein
MTRANQVLIAMAALAGAAFLFSPAGFSQAFPPAGKRAQEYPPWETKVLQPHEVRPAHYSQVTQREIDVAAADGWELVSVAPFVFLNEARGQARQDTVTQAYPAYYFKRSRRDR